jgi:hypothetical protein
VQNAAFVRSRKQFNTSFLIVPWLNLRGGVCVLLLGLKNWREWNIYLVLGLEVFRVSKETLC